MNDLEVRWWPIDKPTPYARNSRKIPERAIDKVAASIKEFGWRVPIVVDKNGVIICGHTRLLAARKLGLQQVAVHVADNLTPAQVKAYRLMDNRSHDETDWDLELLLDAWMHRTNDPILRGPVKAPAGVVVNDVDGISPQEPVKPA